MAFLIRTLIIFGAVFLILRWMRNAVRSSQNPENLSRSGGDSAPETLTPYEILEVDPNASRAEIEKGYKRALAKYHPDKVEHLGDELQKVARQKTQQIIAAYQSLTN